jgi:hypothetical protein
MIRAFLLIAGTILVFCTLFPNDPTPAPEPPPPRDTVVKPATCRPMPQCVDPRPDMGTP